MIKVEILAPAKINLALDITGLEPNGYHKVDMIMQAVSLYERVEVAKSRGYSLRCPGSPLPVGDKNTATKAAEAFFYETGLLAGAEIILHKKVPTRAGLAGGSADAAAVLVGLNQLYKARLSTKQLCQIGAKVGADVPFSIMGGTARAEGTGEILTPLEPLQGCWFVIVMPPGSGVSTPAAYARYDEMGSPVRPDIGAAKSAIEEQNLSKLALHMQNALEHANKGKHTDSLRAEFSSCGAVASSMTGSGAAVYGMFSSKENAEKAFSKLAKIYPMTFLTHPVPFGPKIISST